MAETDQPSAQNITNVSGGVNVGGSATVGGDVVGRDKITVGYTVEQVSTLLTQISSAFQPKPFDGRCPYLGLDAFTEDDADRFFGRETLVSELVARVKESRYVVIAGPSGSGKSSLVRAGLIHALKQGTLPNSDRWLYAVLTPGRDPIESLALAMSRLAKSPDAGKYVREHSAEPGALHEFIESQLSDRQDQRAVIFVDQFEEVFTQVSKEDERLAFLEMLTHAATLENGRVTVLFALRSDFVSNCATYPQLNALLNQQFMQVGAMQPHELVSAIARPALQVGLRIDLDLVAQIVDDMEDEPGALPLMQFALEDLFDAQQTIGGVIALTLNDYLARGGLHKALERHADAAFGKLSESEQQLARTVFGGLIGIGRGMQDTRRTATLDELVPVNVDMAQVKTVVQKLENARLITTGEKDNKYTLAHETLIDAWPWLRRLINENRETIALQNQIAEDAQEWDEHQRDASYLYSGARLATAREQFAANKIVLSGLAQAFVQVGAEAEEAEYRREEARRQKELDDARKLAEAEQLRAAEQTQSAAKLRRGAMYLIGAFGIALLLGIVAVVFGLQSSSLANQNAVIARSAQADANARATAEVIALDKQAEAQRQARIALARQLAAQAISYSDDQMDLSILLSIESYRLEQTAEARDAQLRVLQNQPYLDSFLHGHTETIFCVSFSPDGRLLASASADQTLRLWDVSNPKAPILLGAPLKVQMDPLIVTFSPDGKTLAAGGYDNMIMLWDVSDPETPVLLGTPFQGYSGSVFSLIFSPDGNRLAAGSTDGTITLWDVTNPKTPMRSGAPLKSHTDHVPAIAFSPDGKTLASGSWDKTIILWDVTNPQAAVQLGTPLKAHTSEVVGVAFSPDGGTLVSVSTNGMIAQWNVSNPGAPVQLGLSRTGSRGGVQGVAFSADRKTLAFGHSDKTVTLWDVSSPEAPTQIGAPFAVHMDVVLSVAFSPDGKTLASGSVDTEILLWDVSNRIVLERLGLSLTDLMSAVRSVTFSPDGRTLASGSDDGTIILWDISDPKAPVRLDAPLRGNSAILCMAFSPDGKTLASGDSTIILWNVLDPKTPVRLGTPLTGPSGYILSTAFSPDGRMLAAAGSGSTIFVWDVSDPAAPVRLEVPFGMNSEYVSSVAFSPDGKVLAAGNSSSAITLWDVSNPKAPKPLGTPPRIHSEAVTGMAFSSDGKTFVSSSNDRNRTIILWDVSDPKKPRPLGTPLKGHTDYVFRVAFSPDGKTLASGGRDNLLVWDVSNPNAPVRLGKPLVGHAYPVSSVAFSPDSKMLASASGDQIILWDMNVASWQNRSCNMVGRNLSEAEWKQYFSDEPYHKTCEQWPEGK